MSKSKLQKLTKIFSFPMGEPIWKKPSDQGVCSHNWQFTDLADSQIYPAV